MTHAPPSQPPTVEPTECSRCEIELGTGRGKCPRARDTDMCIDCAVQLDPPMAEAIEAVNTRRGEQRDGKLWAQHEGAFARDH